MSVVCELVMSSKLRQQGHQILRTLDSIERFTVRVNDVDELSVCLVQSHGSGVILVERFCGIQACEK